MAKPYGYVLRGSSGSSDKRQSQPSPVPSAEPSPTVLPSVYYLLGGLQLVTVLAGLLGIFLASPAGQRALFDGVTLPAVWNVGLLAQVLTGTALGVALFGSGAAVIRLLASIEENTRPKATQDASSDGA